MLPLLAAIFIGWPAILNSLLLSTLGILRRDARWFVGGAILSLGFAGYLSNWPHLVFKAVGYLLPLLHLGGALAVRRRRIWLTWLLLLPHAGVAVYLAGVVLSQ